MPVSVFERYPSLSTLRGVVDDQVVERVIGERAEEFEEMRKQARQKIKSVSLSEVFPKELENAGIYLERFLGHWGNIRVEAIAKIALIVSYFKCKNVFEFGTFNGMSTLQMALNTPEDGRVYTLDLPPGAHTSTQNPLGELDIIVAKHLFEHFGTTVGSYFKDHPAGNKITQLLGDSSTFDFSPYYGKMNLVFIDAAHDYENKKSDSENALKMLAPNGVILWDNYDDVLQPDVTRYLIEFSEKHPVCHLRGTFLGCHWNKTT